MSKPRTMTIAVALAVAAGLIGSAAAAAGYLTKDSVPDMVKVLPPPPAAGSGVAAADARAFAATRKLEGQPRWAMAAGDAVVSPDALMGDFACALGVRLTQANAPTLFRLLARTLPDERLVVDPPKDHYARPRPFVAHKGDICAPGKDELAKTASYPSGHATLSWSWGLILAELAPDRATEILERARVYGESRVVCGVHYPSDIEAGRLNGSALVAALHGSAEFRADLEQARAEVAAARKAATGPAGDPARCRLEADTGAHRPW